MQEEVSYRPKLFSSDGTDRAFPTPVNGRAKSANAINFTRPNSQNGIPTGRKREKKAGKGSAGGGKMLLWKQ
jgi:hypothetical protein